MMPTHAHHKANLLHTHCSRIKPNCSTVRHRLKIDVVMFIEVKSEGFLKRNEKGN
jgi:hypothetical protein